jgi:Sap, sulfolipid-1-addressing protein
MLDALAESLPLAVALALSPLAIASVVLMLLSARPRAASVAFLIGFLIAIVVVTAAGYLLASVLPHRGETSISAPWVLLILGAVAIVLAVKQWRSRPKPGDELELPGWIAKVEGITTSSAFVMGAFFGGIKPKNLLLSIGLGVSLEALTLTTGEAAIVIGIVAVIASIPVMVPVIISLVALDRVAGTLDRLRAWMVQNNAAMVGTILLLVGVLLIGQSVSTLVA